MASLCWSLWKSEMGEVGVFWLKWVRLQWESSPSLIQTAQLTQDMDCVPPSSFCDHGAHGRNPLIGWNLYLSIFWHHVLFLLSIAKSYQAGSLTQELQNNIRNIYKITTGLLPRQQFVDIGCFCLFSRRQQEHILCSSPRQAPCPPQPKRKHISSHSTLPQDDPGQAPPP